MNKRAKKQARMARKKAVREQQRRQDDDLSFVHYPKKYQGPQPRSPQLKSWLTKLFNKAVESPRNENVIGAMVVMWHQTRFEILSVAYNIPRYKDEPERRLLFAQNHKLYPDDRDPRRWHADAPCAELRAIEQAEHKLQQLQRQPLASQKWWLLATFPCPCVRCAAKIITTRPQLLMLPGVILHPMRLSKKTRRDLRAGRAVLKAAEIPVATFNVAPTGLKPTLR